MKDVTLSEIQSKNSGEIIDDLQHGRYSILKVAGCDALRREMKVVGWICRTVIWLMWYLAGGKDTYGCFVKMRKIFGKFLGWAAPGDIDAELLDEQKNKCAIYGFNHPSLGEIIRFLRIHMLSSLGSVALFPVNLPWYEALMPVAHLIDGVGVAIVPLITPSTFEKMTKKMAASDKQYVENISKTLMSNYLSKVQEVVAHDKYTIWVAPSATRKATVFSSRLEEAGLKRIDLQTMTLLARTIERTKATGYSFVAVAVVPPAKGGRGLNLLRRYKIFYAGSFSDQEVLTETHTRSESYRGCTFEHTFLSTIAKKLYAIQRDDLIV